jgi:multidrug efflux pump subunit AcrA (membrane-fusion protein)
MRKSTVLKVSAVPAILLVGVFAMQALGSTKKQANMRATPPEARAVETQRVEFADLKLQVEGNGVVESERTLNMISEASGRVTFAKNDLKDGTFVRQGEKIVKIDSRDVANELYGLRADFMNAVASVLPELRLDDARIYKRWFDYFNALDISKPIPELPEITNAQEKIKVST